MGNDPFNVCIPFAWTADVSLYMEFISIVSKKASHIWCSLQDEEFNFAMGSGYGFESQYGGWFLNK